MDMQYEVKESGYGITITSAKFDVVITPQAPLQINMSESAKMEVPQAINYIKSGEAEIKAATDIGVSRISSTVTDGLNQYNANATAKTNAYNDNATDKLSAYNLNAQNLTTAFDTNASDKTTDFNNNAATKKAEIDAAAAVAKQWAIGDPSEPTGNSAKYWANQAASSLSGLESRVTTIESEIPAQASSSNQLADKNFVNSSIATNTATFIGTFNSVAELEAYSGAKDDNDYAFVISTDSAGNTLYNRYKWNGTAWLFEYALNNSSFTANQWAAINSGATTTNIGQIATKADDNAVVHLSGNETITGVKTFTSNMNAKTIELYAPIPYIDFHYDNSTADYTSRIIENSAGNLAIKCTSLTMPTPAASDNSTKGATTAFVKTAISTLLSTLYPVGSIYIGTQSTCPLATLISGSTWVKVSEGRVLQGSDSNHNAGTTIEAGLPNITGGSKPGYIGGTTWPLVVYNPTGAFYSNGAGTSSYSTTSGANLTNGLNFDASRSNSIYGNSNTVQPPAYVVNIWRRTA
jgi:hypothetical protein